MSKLTSYKGLKTEKQFLKLLVANVVSRFGDSLDAIAFGWVMYKITNSASMMALLLAINILPTVILQPIAGVIAERTSKKKAMILCDLGRGTAVILIAILFMTGNLNVATLMLATVVNSSLEAFRVPASSSFTPLVLDKEKYTIGMGLSGGSSRVAEIVGMALAGGIVGLFGAHVALFIDAGTFLFSAIMISFVKVKEVISDVKLNLKEFFSDLKGGFKHLTSNKLLVALAVLGAVMNFTMAPFNSFNTIFVGNDLQLGAEWLSFFALAMSGGMALGSLAMPKLEKFISRRIMIFFGGILTVLFYASLWLAPQLIGTKPFMLGLGLFTCVLMGIASGTISTIYASSFMTIVDKDYLARCSGIINAMLTCIMPVASLICSGLALFMTVPQIFLFCSGICLVLYIGMLFSKELKKL